MTTLSRREMLLTPVALAATSAVAAAATEKMTLAMHQNTSNGAGYRKSLEGWARAGIKNVEITNVLLDDFLKTDSLEAATRLISDLGLTLVQAATGTTEIWEPNPNRAAALENLKMRCEMFAKMGLHRVYSPTTCSKKVTEDDYKAGIDNIHDAGEAAKQFGTTLRIEFLRSSTFIATLPTLLKMTRAAAHPNIEPMLDWATISGPASINSRISIQSAPEKLATFTFRTCPIFRVNYWTPPLESFPVTESARSHEFWASSRKKGMPARSRWNSSCRNSSKAIRMKSPEKSA